MIIYSIVRKLFYFFLGSSKTCLGKEEESGGKLKNDAGKKRKMKKIDDSSSQWFKAYQKEKRSRIILHELLSSMIKAIVETDSEN